MGSSPPPWLENARMLREAERLSWRQLAARTGVSVSTLQYHLQPGRRERERRRSRQNNRRHRDEILEHKRQRNRALPVPPFQARGTCRLSG